MVVAVVFPLALALISGSGDTMVTINGTSTAISDVVDPSVLTLLTVLLPIIAVIGIIMYFLPSGSKGSSGA